MGGERRRRRLRRTGRSPAAESTTASPVIDELDGAGDLDPGDNEGTADSLDSVASGEEHATPPVQPSPAPATAAPAPAPPVPGPPIPGPPGDERAGRRGPRGAGRGPRAGAAGAQHRPSPADLAELPGPFALTVGVHDPEPPVDQHPQHADDPSGERGLRGLVGGGSSQVNVAAAMRARDASRPGDEYLAAAEADLPIVRRGWVPRDELPRAGGH